MKPLFAFVFLIFTPLCVSAQEASETTEASGEMQVLQPDADDLNQFLWKNRPLVVMADSPNDPRFVQQMEFINERIEELAERDVVVLTDTDPSVGSALRERLHPRGFMLVLIGKDGTIYLRKPFPWDVREISRSIDKMPIRQQEIRDRRGLN